MPVRDLTVETYWTADTRRHHAPKTMLRLKGHWLKEAGFDANTAATVTVRPHCLTITTRGANTMHQQPPTLDDLLAAVRAAVNAQLDAHPQGVYPDQLATTIAEQIAPTDARSLLLLAALDDPELAERHNWHQPPAPVADVIRSNLIDRLWEEAARAILD
jgi:hypothetical protein